MKVACFDEDTTGRKAAHKNSVLGSKPGEKVARLLFCIFYNQIL